MPIVITGNTQYQKPIAGYSKIDYEYPYDLDLSPNSELHQRIVGRLQRYADDAFGVMSTRFDTWNEVDNMMTAFIPLSDYEKNLKGNRYGRDSHNMMHRHTKPVSIVVPYSYATFETIMTYMTQAFLSDPIFQYGGTGPDSTTKAMLLQAVVNSQVRKFKSALSMHTAMGDSLKYGLGASTFEWKEHWGSKTSTNEVGQYDGEGRFLGMHSERFREQVLLYEGNSIIPVDPYRCLFDPNTSIHRIQECEYVGWSSLETYFNMLDRERTDESVFNVKYIGEDSHLRQYMSKYTPDQSHRQKNQYGGGTSSGIMTAHTNYLTNVHMFVNLLPDEWGLPGDEQLNPDGMYPEKWLFTMTSDNMLTRCVRMNLDHGMYPVACASPDFDGYTMTPIGRMEMLHGLQDGMNWLYNSHITNVRKAINDMLIVDPSLVVMKDLANPEPGKLVRLRRAAWGRGVENAVKQLQINDITRTNINDSAYVMDIMQRVSAAVDSVQGVVRGGGERRSATEYRGAATSAMSRLEHIAKIISMQYNHDLSYMIAAQTQQFMSQPQWAKMTEDQQQMLNMVYGQEGTWVDPEDIQIDYDVVIGDGSIPTAGSANGDLLVQMFQIVAADPELRQTFDVPKMYTRLATMFGDRNAFDFVRKGGQVQAAVMPDGEVADAAQAGNIVPIDQAA